MQILSPLCSMLQPPPYSTSVASCFSREIYRQLCLKRAPGTIRASASLWAAGDRCGPFLSAVDVTVRTAHNLSAHFCSRHSADKHGPRSPDFPGTFGLTLFGTEALKLHGAMNAYIMFWRFVKVVPLVVHFNPKASQTAGNWQHLCLPHKCS